MSNKRNSDVYTDCHKIVMNTNYFFYIFIGGRGIGKTYSMLKNSYLAGQRVIYLRRTNEILANCCNDVVNPYKAINLNEATNIKVEMAKGLAVIYDVKDEENNIKDIIGYGCALSTFGNLRGADFSDVDIIIFDEFINLLPVRTIKNESVYLFNLIETVNRNRELDGRPPVKVVLTSNAETIDDDIIRALGLADKIQEMKMNNETKYTDEDRGLYLELLENRTVINMKETTALYKLTQGTSYYEMALNNEFTKDYFGDIGKFNYNELTPVCCYENLYFYQHKSRDLMYVSYRKANCKRFNEHNIKQFKREYGFKVLWYMETSQILYMNYEIKLKVRDLMKNK